MPLPPAAGLTLSEAERKQLEAFGRQRSSPRGIVLRINIVLSAAEGLANRVVARRLSTSVPTVLLWRKRFEADGIAGLLKDRPRSGRSKLISEQREAAIVEATMKTTPKDATQWSVRAMAAAQEVSSATVQRIWKKHKLQPHRVKSFTAAAGNHSRPLSQIIRQVQLNHIHPGRSMQNGHVESFSGRLRDEYLNASWFQNLMDAQVKIADWREEHNVERPHSSLGYRTPNEFAEALKSSIMAR